jgi:hypothetical protein
VLLQALARCNRVRARILPTHIAAHAHGCPLGGEHRERAAIAVQTNVRNQLTGVLAIAEATKDGVGEANDSVAEKGFASEKGQ